jgi:excinuclease ABC subunit A
VRAGFFEIRSRVSFLQRPFGACPACHEISGNIIELDMGLVVPDPAKSILQNALGWSKPHYRGTACQAPSGRRRGKVRSMSVGGADRRGAALCHRRRHQFARIRCEGIRGFFRWLERKKYKVHVACFSAATAAI